MARSLLRPRQPMPWSLYFLLSLSPESRFRQGSYWTDHIDIILGVGKRVLRYWHWHTGTRNRQWFGGPGYAPRAIGSRSVRPRSIVRNGTGGGCVNVVYHNLGCSGLARSCDASRLVTHCYSRHIFLGEVIFFLAWSKLGVSWLRVGVTV